MNHGLLQMVVFNMRGELKRVTSFGSTGRLLRFLFLHAEPVDGQVNHGGFTDHKLRNTGLRDAMWLAG